MITQWEVTNRLKELDLIDRVLKKYGCKLVTLYRRQCSKSAWTKINAKRQNGYLRRAYKQLRKEEKQKAKVKRKDMPIWMQSSKEKQGEIRKSSSVNNSKKQRKATEWERLEIYLFKKIRDSISLSSFTFMKRLFKKCSREHFMQRWAQ